jgi:hypothetical protein
MDRQTDASKVAGSLLFVSKIFFNFLALSILFLDPFTEFFTFIG